MKGLSVYRCVLLLCVVVVVWGAVCRKAVFCLCF